MTSGLARRAVAAVIASLAMGFASPLSSQAVSVSPMSLFLDQATRSGRLTLANDGDRPAEVEIGFAFGYARSDSLGNVSVPLAEAAGPGEPTLIPYLRAFPRRLRLAPGQRGMVRILVTAPTGLEDGEYWARVLVAASGADAPVELKSERVSATLNIRSVVAVAANYRHGRVGTSLEVEGASAKATAGSVRLLLDLGRDGNAAWLGRVRAQVVDSAGRVMGSSAEDVAVYRPLRWGVTIPLDRAPEGGPVAVRFELSTERPDGQPGTLLEAPAVRGSVPVG